MKASILDLRRRMREVLEALERNESVTVLYRGKAKAILKPVSARDEHARTADHPAFGMWADRQDFDDVTATVRRIRRGRFDAL